MSVNTHAMVPAAPKSGAGADGSGGSGQASAKEAAAAFQSVLHGMKRGEAPVEGGGEQSGRQSGQGQNQANAETGDTSEANANSAESNTGPSTSVTYSTSNLVNALRQVSSNMHARDAAGDGSALEENRSVPQTPLSGDAALYAGAAVSMPANAVLAARNAASAQGSGQPSAQLPAHLQAALPGAQAPGPEGVEGARTGTSSLFAQFGVEPETVGDPLLSGAGRRSLLPEEASGTVKILRQETHFAPNMRLSPAQQVGDQIATALKTLSADGQQGQAGVTHRAEGPVLKTLDIQLTPHELGTVKVSLRMVGDSVEVTLQTSNPQTADLLKQDRQLLDQMLRATGFKADTITIQAADDRGAVQAGPTASNTAGSGQNASGNGAFSEGQAQNSDRNASGQDQDRPGQNQQEHGGLSGETARGNTHEEDTGNSLSDGIYL
ncbi:flagellar hook-length control protein FliK [Labrenzia sp. VG12]|uniref:flagellar hook-length control protein FliK n=1 Tax=Labrenzia sp. VG12 TaxID=2021862 RepID=UPI000B8C2B88|nr:flagellar hook-length control protein FliK [Labrenzia sp. VG12]ASP32960.1 hypothetical protein CHH27_06590 [Labrenzia sp. VG12]